MVDQAQEHSDDCAWLSYGKSEWQEFLNRGNKIMSIELYMYNSAPFEQGLVRLSIEKPLGNILTEKTLSCDDIAPGYTDIWYSFDIDPDVTLVDGQKYFIVLYYAGPCELCWHGAYNNRYPDGKSSRGGDWDYCFRTIVDKSRPHDKPTTPIIDRADQVQNTFNTHEYLSRYSYYAQSFRPTLPKLTKVFLYLRSYHYGTEMKVAIRSDLNGADLTSKTISTNDINPEYVWTWVEFDFPDIEVVPYDTYFIEIEHYSGGDVDLVALACNDQNPYDHGELWVTSSYSMNWQSKPLFDCCFQTYGGEGKPRNILRYSILEIIIEKYLNMLPMISSILNI
jgi:hypothetical protein